MPNGGPDNCGTCGFNRRNRGIWRNPQPDETVTAYCELRGIHPTGDHWTYCENWHTRMRKIAGPVYKSGLYEGGYHRIPWHGDVEPELNASGTCHECRQPFDDGISIPTVEGAPAEFCSNRHYFQWWQRHHPGEEAPMSHGFL